jgi:hypothetical protein
MEKPSLHQHGPLATPSGEELCLLPFLHLLPVLEKAPLHFLLSLLLFFILCVCVCVCVCVCGAQSLVHASQGLYYFKNGQRDRLCAVLSETGGKVGLKPVPSFLSLTSDMNKYQAL